MPWGAIMRKYSGIAVLAFFGFLTLHAAAVAAESAVPEPFRGFDDSSEHSITYDDYSNLLGVVVANVGQSDRQMSQPVQDITGTRMKSKVKKFTAFEGNRFHYEAFVDNESGQAYLLNIQKSLEQLPSEMPLENFSRDEQLAYWLNLYNVTVLNQVIAAYPKRTLKKITIGRSSIFSKKLLTVAGVPLSLDDIQFTILRQNYNNNPLIMYGLYQGIVGGPNIRASAYSGGSVYHALEENAFEFVNSNRGTFDKGRGDGVLQVSSLYDRSRSYFPEFDSDLAQHLLQYLEGDERTALQAASQLDPDIDDWTVTDLGGTQHEVGRSLAHNNAALMDSYKSNRRNVDGSIRVATLKIEREKRDPEEDDVREEDLERFPIEGASVEDLEIEDMEPTE